MKKAEGSGGSFSSKTLYLAVLTPMLIAAAAVSIAIFTRPPVKPPVAGTLTIPADMKFISDCGDDEKDQAVDYSDGTIEVIVDGQTKKKDNGSGKCPQVDYDKGPGSDTVHFRSFSFTGPVTANSRISIIFYDEEEYEGESWSVFSGTVNEFQRKCNEQDLGLVFVPKAN